MSDIITEDLSEVIKVRREKLNTMLEAGNNPYEIVSFDKDRKSVV